MLLKDLTGKKVCILGFGREGRATLQAIRDAGVECEITIADKNSEAVESGKWNVDHTQGGSEYLNNLDHFDIVIKSPGIPPSELPTFHFPPSTSTQIFLDEAAAAGARVIGVTGSKGKSTTSSLIAHILRTAKQTDEAERANVQTCPTGRRACNVLLVGNIGEPALKHLKHLKKNTIFVHEMSSYQLMDLTSSPPIAVITSFFPEHLDYHASEAAYKAAKQRITKSQSTKDVVFFNAESAGAKDIADASPGTKIPVTIDDAPVRLDQTKLIGRHNLMNIALAASVAKYIGSLEYSISGPFDHSTISAAIRSFLPLPHRLQRCGEHGGGAWVDDSISTTPESAIAALDALGDGVQTMILGGQDRGNDFTKLAERIRSSNVRTVILLGESGVRIRHALLAASALVIIHRAGSMEEAVHLAKQHTNTFHIPNSPSAGLRAGKFQIPIVLLSPASPSYDMFKNFEERGEKFVKAILGKS